MDQQGYEAREIRGAIIETLQPFYPNSLRAGSLFAEFIRKQYPAVDWQSVYGHLTYLGQRGFVEAVADSLDRSGDPKRVYYRLTASGLDLALKVASDPAVGLESI